MKKTKKIINTTPQFDIFDQKWSHYLMIGFLFAVISILFFNIGYLNYAPRAHDTQQWRWSAQQTIEHNKQHGGRALWTDNVFSGMPTYLLSFPARFPFLHNLISAFDFLISWRVMYLIFGAIGMYILLVRMKFSPLVACFSAISFALSCHFIGLIEIGHNTKFRAIMYIPWIFLTFEALREKRSFLALGLFSICIIDQLRVNHFQISYYTYLMLGMYWIVFLIESIYKKTYRDYAVFTVMALAGLVISALAVANPYLSTYEYSHYTIRGGEGLSTDYATSWSFGVGEVFSFLVPKIYGGVSPFYWGTMPFTQTFHYMGVVVFYLAIFGGVFCFKDNRVKALCIISFIVLLMSFGKHFPALSNFLLQYFPLWNKFRVPATILAIMQFSFPLLAAFGIKRAIDKIGADDVVFNRTLFVSMLASVGIFILFYAGSDVFSSLSFVKPEDFHRYQPSEIDRLKGMRFDLLTSSGMTSFAILTGATLGLWLMVKGYLKKNIVLILLLTLTITDLSLINKNHFQEGTLVKENSIQKEFRTLETDLALLEDDDVFRIFPFHDFGNSRWSYYHQTIGGYHGAKLSRYQDVLDRNLYAELTAQVHLNWNIVNMLNVKYIIFNGRADLPGLEHIKTEAVDRQTQYWLYQNINALPRAWFVERQELHNDKRSIFLRLNDPDFDPAKTVIVEEEVPEFSYSEDFEVKLISRDMHHSTWETSNSRTGFLVISEIDYPAGWNVYINDVKTEIYTANYILRGVVVPIGENLIEMRFEPTSYRISVILSAIGLLLALGLTGFGVWQYYHSNYGKGIVYKVVS